MYELQCHVAVLLTLHTGKRPGVLCGIKLDDIFGAKKFNVQSRRKTAEATYVIQVVLSSEYAVFKTVQISHIVVTETFLVLLEALAFVRQVINKSQLQARLLTSAKDFPLCRISNLLMKAWGDAGCEGRFTSTMMRHTIMTHSRNVEKNLSVEEIKALARGMDHSVRMAEKVYLHEKEKLQVDLSKIIREILELNDWEKELKEGIEEEIERQVEDGEMELVGSALVGQSRDGDGEEGKRKRKIGNMEVIFASEDTELVRKLFTTYINYKVKNPEEKVRGSEITEKYYKQIKGLPKKSPFLALEKYPTDKIVTKVRTLITQEKQRKANAEKNQKKSSEKAHISNRDNPKL